MEQEPDPLVAAAQEFARRHLDSRLIWILTEAGARDGKLHRDGVGLWARLPWLERLGILIRWTRALEEGTLPAGPQSPVDKAAAIRANAQALEAAREALRNMLVGRPLTDEQQHLITQERAKVEAQIVRGNKLAALAWELGYAAAWGLLTAPAPPADSAASPAPSEGRTGPRPAPPVRVRSFTPRPKPLLRRPLPRPTTEHRE